jgi:hypothetical protein
LFSIKNIFIILLSFYFVKLKAQPLHEYFFNSNFNGTNGGPTLTQNLACGAVNGAFGTQTIATIGSTCTIADVFCFNQGGGLNYPNSSYITNQYSINLFFKFNILGGWSRIIDFSNSTSDAGIYWLNDCLNFFPNGNVGTCPYFLANTYYLFTFVRNGTTNIITVYVNGSLFGSYNDAGNLYAPASNTTPIIFFRDDNAVPCEAKPGCVKYLSITSATMNALQINTTFTNICNVILPIELSSFDVSKKGGKVELHWKTQFEKSNQSFEVERSGDGIYFEKIKEVKSNELGQQQAYSYIDDKPFEGLNYYRLKQINTNATYDYSIIKSITMSSELHLIYPNPADNWLFVKEDIPNNELIIKTILGVEVLKTKLDKEKRIRISELPSGTYLIYTSSKIEKLIINR